MDVGAKYLVPEIVITSQLLSSLPPLLSSAPQMIAPFASVSKTPVPVQEGKEIFKSLADIPPENVEVPVVNEVIVLVAVIRPTLRFPVIIPSPSKEKPLAGDVVPIPNEPASVITKATVEVLPSGSKLM